MNLKIVLSLDMPPKPIVKSRKCREIVDGCHLLRISHNYVGGFLADSTRFIIAFRF